MYTLIWPQSKPLKWNVLKKKITEVKKEKKISFNMLQLRSMYESLNLHEV